MLETIDLPCTGLYSDVLYAAISTRKCDLCRNRCPSCCAYHLAVVRLGPYDVRCVFQAIKDVSASYDALVDLLESTENFLRRLDIYTKIPPTTAMTEIILKILVELLSILAIATHEVKRGRLSVSFSVDMSLFAQ
jgi:hypothetical protein